NKLPPKNWLDDRDLCNCDECLWGVRFWFYRTYFNDWELGMARVSCRLGCAHLYCAPRLVASINEEAASRRSESRKRLPYAFMAFFARLEDNYFHGKSIAHVLYINYVVARHFTSAAIRCE